jgi:hypothetical protein
MFFQNTTLQKLNGFPKHNVSETGHVSKTQRLTNCMCYQNTTFQKIDVFPKFIASKTACAFFQVKG